MHSAAVKIYILVSLLNWPLDNHAKQKITKQNKNCKYLFQVGMPGMKRDCGGAAGVLGAFRAAVKQVWSVEFYILLYRPW